MLTVALGQLLFDDALRLAWAFKIPVLVNDFQVYYRAAGQTDPYEIASHIERATYRPFVSPPSLLPWIRWLTLLPFNLAWIVWTLASIIAYMLAAKRFVGFPRDILAVLSFGSIEALIAGQVTLILGAAAMLGCSLMKQRPILSGIVFGITATVKPQILVALPFALWASKERRVLFATFLTGLTIGAICVVSQGAAIWLKWLSVVQQFAAWLPNSQFRTFGVTPTNLAAIASVGPTLTNCIFMIGAALGIYTVWQTFSGTENPRLRLGALVVGYLLCSRYALVYELALIAPLAAKWLFDRKAPAYCWIAGALAIACSTGQYTHLQIGGFAPPILAFALILTSRTERTKKVLEACDY